MMSVKIRENKNRVEHAGMSWSPWEWTEICVSLITTNLDGAAILQKLGCFITELNTHLKLEKLKDLGEGGALEGLAIISPMK